MPRRAAPAAAPSLFEALPVGGELSALVFDAQLRVEAASAGAAPLFGREVIGAAASELFVHFEPPAAEAALDLTARGSRARRVRAFWRPGGGRATLVLVDLEALSRGPNAEAAAVSRLVSRVVHEIRNPLASVKLVVQTLGRASLEERFGRRLAVAGREVRTIERILHALAGLARLSSPAAEVPIEGIVEAASAELRRECEEQSVRLRLEVSPGLPCLPLDEKRVQLALVQLAGLLCHGLESGELRLRAAAHGEGIALQVDAEPLPSWRPGGAELSVELAALVAAEHGGRLEASEGRFVLLLGAGGRAGR